MALSKVNYVDNQTIITAQNLNDIQNEIIQNTELIKKAAPRNLLDNSDFRNPVNQRGQTQYVGSYTIDRWTNYGEDAVTVNNGYISKTGVLFQYIIDLDVDKTYTGAICTNDGKIAVYTGTLKGGLGDWASKIYCNEGSDGITTFRITSNATDVVWAALYEGEYTTETLPEYQPKGYGTELAECQRYLFRQYMPDSFFAARVFSSDPTKVDVTIPLPAVMIDEYPS